MENVIPASVTSISSRRKVNEKIGKEGWIRRVKDRDQKGERRNFRAIIVDITKFQAFSDSEDFLSLWSFHGGISSGLGWSLCA